MKTKHNSGYSVTEFVILAPIIIIIWFFLISINESIEHKQMITIASSNISQSLPDTATTVSIFGENNSTNKNNSSVSKNLIVQLFSNLNNTTTALVSKDESGKSSLTSQLESNQNGHAFDIKSEIKTRQMFEKGGWSDERRERVGETQLVSNSEIYTAGDKFSAEVSANVPTILDFLKQDELPFIISDRDSMRKTQIDVSIPSLAGILPTAEISKLVGNEKKEVEGAISKKYDISTIYFHETETGYHSTKNSNSAMLGIVMGLAVASKEVEGWSKKALDNKNLGSFTMNCLYFMSANNNCFKPDIGGGNQYSNLLKSAVFTKGIYDFIKAVLTLGTSAFLEEIAKSVSQEAVNQIVEQVVDQVETKVMDMAKEKATQFTTEFTNKLKLNPMEAGLNNLASKKEELLNTNSHLEKSLSK